MWRAQPVRGTDVRHAEASEPEPVDVGHRVRDAGQRGHPSNRTDVARHPVTPWTQRAVLP
jgi:hypothetical protein